jgi:hypothetical protein
MSCLVTEDLDTITQLFIQNSEEKEFITEEAEEVIQNLKSILTYEHQRRSIHTALGVWYCIKKEKAHYLSTLPLNILLYLFLSISKNYLLSHLDF